MKMYNYYKKHSIMATYKLRILKTRHKKEKKEKEATHQRRP